MNIVGLDEIVFGVKDVPACSTYLIDYGLKPVNISEAGGRFEALDGTAVILLDENDKDLPPKISDNCQLRRTVLGVADEASLKAIVDELRKDREVKEIAPSVFESVDDSGFVIAFQVSVRQPIEKIGELSNAPGSPMQRTVNQLGVDTNTGPIHPRTLSHIVYFVPDVAKAEAFYVERLGFSCTDRFEGTGPFLQPAGTLDHHTHFLIQAPEHIKGVEHFTFHFSGPTEMIQNGTQFIEKDYQAFWGPGRHIFGSNWFWYFKSPFGCNIEMDADMDLHDKSWTPRVDDISSDTSQAFLLRYREKWSPNPLSPPEGDYA